MTRATMVVFFLAVVGWAVPVDPPPVGELISIGHASFTSVAPASAARRSSSKMAAPRSHSTGHSYNQKLQGSRESAPSDRAGYAGSDPGPEFDTLDQASHDLHQLLAHSLGGRLVRYYQAKHPSDVVGVVLVDSSHEESFEPVGLKIVRIPKLSAKQYQDLIDEAKAHRPKNPQPDPVPTTIFPPYDKLPAEFQTLHLWALKKGNGF